MILNVIEWLLVPAGLSISETADVLGFYHTIISKVYIEWSEKVKKKIVSSSWVILN